MREKVTFSHVWGLIVFVGACFGLALFLWGAFGGSVPLAPRQYEMHVSFPDASLLVPQADVRIAGVNVGKVRERHLDPKTHRTVATLSIDSQYAPRPADTKAILRQKTLLGEVYVELSAGTPGSPKLGDEGTLPPGRSAPTVRVDDFLATFDAKTRRDLATWLTEAGVAYKDQAPAINRFLAALDPTVTATDDVMAVLDEEGAATDTLVRNGGASLAALTERRGQLAKLVTASNGAFSATAARNAQLAETFRLLPTFLTETRLTTAQLAQFAVKATPLINQLRPAARVLTPTLQNLQEVAPSLSTLMTGVKPLSQASKQGVPALEQQLALSIPVLKRATPYLGQLNPILSYASKYRRDLTGAIANVAAATQATLPGAGTVGPLHYARGAVPVNLEALSAYPQRFGTSRTNPYPQPGSALELTKGLAQFGGLPCVNRTIPTLSTEIPADLRALYSASYFTDDPSGPSCRYASPLGPAVNAGTKDFPQLTTAPTVRR